MLVETYSRHEPRCACNDTENRQLEHRFGVQPNILNNDRSGASCRCQYVRSRNTEPIADAAVFLHSLGGEYDCGLVAYLHRAQLSAENAVWYLFSSSPDRFDFLGINFYATNNSSGIRSEPCNDRVNFRFI